MRILAVTLMLAGCAGVPDRPDPDVAGWNEALLAVADAEDGFLTLKGVRTAAMLHVAMLDAWRLASGDGTPWVCEADARNVAPQAAASAAALHIATRAYPDDAETFAALARLSNNAAAGTLGAACADQVIAWREDDNWNSAGTYEWRPPAPGVYADFSEHSGTPAGFVFGAGWPDTIPFVLSEIPRVPPPPPIDSANYAAAWDEVRRVGAAASRERTADQTHLAMWWKDFAERSFNRLARSLVRDHTPSTDEQLALFARLNMALFDAYVASFDNKYHYNHWRPYSAIRAADTDGNDATMTAADWTNLHGHTYAFPSYPSAHGTVCAAAATVLAATFGDNFAFRMLTAEVDSQGPMSAPTAMHPPYRDFVSFDAAARECAASRVYLGIHFRYDSDAGYALGNTVGGYVIEHRQ